MSERDYKEAEAQINIKLEGNAKVVVLMLAHIISELDWSVAGFVDVEVTNLLVQGRLPKEQE